MIRLVVESQRAQSGARTAQQAVRNLTNQLNALKTGQVGVTTAGMAYSKVNGGLINTTTAAKEAVRAFAREQKILKAAIDEAKLSMTRQERATFDSMMSQQGMANVTGSATFALTSLGQAFADSGQFSMGFAQGIRAVTNNAQQVMFAMTMLVGQVGSVTKAMQALKATMTGPLGILFAFQIGSAALEAFSTRAQAAKKDTDDLTSALDNAAKSAISIGDDIEKSFKVDTIAVDGAMAAISTLLDGYDVLEERAGQSKFLAGVAVDTKTIRNIEAAQQRLENLSDEERENLEANRAILKVLKERKAEIEAALAIQRAARELGLKEEDDLKRKSAVLKGLKGMVIAPGVDFSALDALIASVEGGVMQRLGGSMGEIVVRTEAQRIRREIAGTAELPYQLADGMADAARRSASEMANMSQSFFGTVQGFAVTNKDAITEAAAISRIAIGTIGQSFMTIARTGDEVNTRMFNAGKAFAIANAVINTSEGVTKALAQGGFLSGIPMAAAVAAAGAAQIAVIASTRPGGSSRGTRVGPISSGTNYVAGISSVSQLSGATSASAIPTGTSSSRTQQSYKLQASGRDLVLSIKNEIAAQRRLGVSDPLGIRA